MALDLDHIIASISNDKVARLPPVQSWQPAYAGEIDIYIDENMCWFHEGTAFEREALVRLLASLLRKEGEDYYLVTPAEKMKIRVDDVPFSIINMQQNDAPVHHKVLVTNTEDLVRLENPAQWQLREYRGGLVPYVLVRDDLWARVNRTVYYQMIALSHEQTSANVTHIYLNSHNTDFLLGEY